MVIPSCIIEVFFSFLLLNKATNNTISERIIKWLPLTGEPNHFPTKHHLSTPPPRPAFGRRVAQTHSATSHRSLTRPHVRISYRWNSSLCNLPSHNTTSKWSFLTYNIKNVERAKRVLGANVSAAGHRCSLSTVLQNKRENKKKIKSNDDILFILCLSLDTLRFLAPARLKVETTPGSVSWGHPARWFASWVCYAWVTWPLFFMQITGFFLFSVKN